MTTVRDLAIDYIYAHSQRVTDENYVDGMYVLQWWSVGGSLVRAREDSYLADPLRFADRMVLNGAREKP